MEFEAALAQEALGVFGRTGLTPSQLADGLTECKEVRQSWVDAYVKMRDTLRALADAADVVGVKYFDTDTMDPEVEAMQKATQAARAALEN